MPSVLFICTANICRSPMASALMEKRIQGEPDASEWKVESAGTWAQEGLPPAEKSEILLGSIGLDISRHRSRCVTWEMLSQFNLILTMEHGHKEALRVEFPDLAGRIYLLSEMVGADFDIRDPFGGTIDEYEETLLEIDQILADGYQKIRELAGAAGHP